MCAKLVRKVNIYGLSDSHCLTALTRVFPEGITGNSQGIPYFVTTVLTKVPTIPRDARYICEHRVLFPFPKCPRGNKMKKEIVFI